MISALTHVAVQAVVDALDGYSFRARDEAELQEQVATALAAVSQIWIDREVRVSGGRLDIMVHAYGSSVVIELKVSGTAAAVERQAQRYAKLIEVDAVMVVTTSSRLARALGGSLECQRGAALGGKPFRVIALRTS